MISTQNALQKRSPLIQPSSPSLLIIFSYADYLHLARVKIRSINHYLDSKYNYKRDHRLRALEHLCTRMPYHISIRDNPIAKMM